MPSQPQYLALPHLFEGRLFRVPDYQRGYAWTDKQLEDLWSDIMLLDDSAQHFTGMVVVEHRDKLPHPDRLEDLEVLEVIDGQQRLTTLVLLMHRLAAELEAVKPETAGKLREKYLGSMGWHRLELNDDSRQYFQDLLAQGEPPAHTENASQQNLQRAARFFSRKMEELSSDAASGESAVATVIKRLQSNLRFVFYQVDDDAEAGLIFEVMNNRGKPLSEADRLKNYLMYLAHKVEMPPAQAKEIAGRWGGVFKHVMRGSRDGAVSPDDEARLLRSHWAMYREPGDPKELRGLTISERIKKSYELDRTGTEDARRERNAALRDAIDRYTTSLLTSAGDFAEINNALAPGMLGWIDDSAVRERTQLHLESFHRMGHGAPAVPVLMAGARRLRPHPELFEELARALSVFSFRVYGMCNWRPYTQRPQFRRLSHELFQTNDAQAATKARELIERIRAWTRKKAPDERLAESLRDPDFYNQQTPREIRYLFYEYERRLCAGPVPGLDWTTFADGKKTQVEHVWPQSREGYHLGGDEERHAENVNRLGNLTVTHLNQSLGNRTFDAKKPIYERSALLIESRLARYDDWGLDVVQVREDALVAFALEKWAIECEDPSA